MGAQSGWLDSAFEAVAIDDEGRACRDIPEAACRDETGNFFTHVGSLFLSKGADSLIDPKLVLSWLIQAVGAPTALVGLLVPIREAGALLPQMFIAGALRRLPKRKWAWSIGAALQGISAIAIAASAYFLSGLRAGVVILCLLGVLAIARSICSVCYKDVLGKTIDKNRRGRTTGLAGSLAAIVAISFGTLLFLEVFDRFNLVLAAILLAGLFWIIAGGLFTTLTEAPGATEGSANAFWTAIENLEYLKSEPQLRIFILTRSLLTATAFAPPFMVALGSIDETGLGNLGWLVLASATAALCSSFVWGSVSDQSSRKVLIIAAILGACSLLATSVLSYLGMLTSSWAIPLLLFVLMIAYQGVRLGRSTHLVDMANEDTRAAFTAISNTFIGIVLLAGSVFTLVAQFAGAATVIIICAVMCVGAAFAATGLEEVQD